MAEHLGNNNEIELLWKEWETGRFSEWARTQADTDGTLLQALWSIVQEAFTAGYKGNNIVDSTTASEDDSTGSGGGAS